MSQRSSPPVDFPWSSPECCKVDITPPQFGAPQVQVSQVRRGPSCTCPAAMSFTVSPTTLSQACLSSLSQQMLCSTFPDKLRATGYHIPPFPLQRSPLCAIPHSFLPSEKQWPSCSRKIIFPVLWTCLSGDSCTCSHISSTDSSPEAYKRLPSPGISLFVLRCPCTPSGL